MSLMPTVLGLDLETYSSAPLPKCGVYRYCDSPDFEILLLSYAFDDEPVQTVDLACGESIPEDVLSALRDPQIIKSAFNANFERVCLSYYLRRHLEATARNCLATESTQLPPEEENHLIAKAHTYPITDKWLDPRQWRCTAVMAAYLTLPSRLADVAVALGTTEKKMEEGKDLIRYFSMPCKPTKTNGGRTRNRPSDAPDKWKVYKRYNAQDVETERAIRKVLEKHPMPDHEWELYALDQTINDRGVRIDKELVKSAIAVDAAFTQAAYQRAKELTGLENPGSVIQLKAWLAQNDAPMESLAQKVVQERLVQEKLAQEKAAQGKASTAEGSVGELLKLRLELSKTSVKKYESMARCVCGDGRIHGLLQFYGANRTGRWAGRLVQAQNLPQNHLPDLDLAREIVKTGDEEMLDTLFASVPGTLSELIRTAFIPMDGCRFLVADFSAIEARVLAWLANEEWVLEEFRGKGKIYEATASRMYHIPKESIVKGNPNYAYRQKGKQATLSCGYGGGVGALKAMGASMPEKEMQPLVDAWRAANPNIVAFWSALDHAARKVIREKTTARVGKVVLFWQEGRMFMRLPSGRNLCYQSPHFTENRFGSDAICYYAPNAAGKMVVQETFGGKLAENATQAIARDILAHALMTLEKNGYPVVFHVHDEAVMEMPNGVGSVDEASRLMCQNPEWALDLPLKAAGYECFSYRKD